MQNNNTPDNDVDAIRNALAAYKNGHPAAQIQVQRRNEVIIRIRVIDPDFVRLDRVDRDNEVWKILGKLPEEVQSQITMVLLLAPDETSTSFANMDFEHPVALSH